MLHSALRTLGYTLIRSRIGFPSGVSFQTFANQARLRDAIRRLGINCVLDVGANEGWSSAHLRMMGYRGHIVTFEPLAENQAKIAAHANGDQRWKSVQVALGAREETRSFNVIRSADGGSSNFSSFLDPRDWDVAEVVDVDVRRLDSFGDLLPPEPRIFLKVDTQGYDVNVVRGAEGVLDKVVLLQSEISVTPIYGGMPHYTEALTFYESLGFSLHDLWVVNRAKDGRVQEYDCLMVKGERSATRRPEHPRGDASPLPARGQKFNGVHRLRRPERSNSRSS